MQKGFTLIEISIVLVIISLIVGGVLFGRDLIDIANIRAQISQVDKLSMAVNAFRLKYSALPGDMTPNQAAQFGFTVGSGCAGAEGQRDGNGVLHGAPSPFIYSQGYGETSLFWQDLGASGLNGFIPEVTINCDGCPAIAQADIGKYFPASSLSKTAYIYLYGLSGVNWFGLSGIPVINTCGGIVTTGAIKVLHARSIDTKIDDGKPLTGGVQASVALSASAIGQAYNSWGPSDPLQCFNGNPTTFPSGEYSTNSAAGNYPDSLNCSLSFRFQ
jgi:prepilin-type N-terminal cleavage/methylation domain-containing protein